MINREFVITPIDTPAGVALRAADRSGVERQGPRLEQTVGTQPTQFPYTVADTRAYYEEIADSYWRFWGPDLHWGLFRRPGLSLKEAANAATRWFLAGLEIRPGETVCDLACGSGSALTHLAREVGVQLVGIDITTRQLELARAAWRETRPILAAEPPLIQADAHTLPLPSRTFDVVYCLSAFYHFHDKPKVLREIARVLKPGGRFFFDDVVEVGEGLRDSERVEFFARQRLTNLASAPEYRHLISTAGFNLVEEEDLSQDLLRTYETAGSMLLNDRASLDELGEERSQRLLRGFKLLGKAAHQQRLGWTAFWAVRCD